MTLSSFLISPIQRVPRYCMLLEGLVKSTPAAHPDHSLLAQSLAAVSFALSFALSFEL